jgi:hypothetical protein
MDEPKERECRFVKSERGRTVFCTTCGRSPEAILRSGPDECQAAAREARAKYDDREHRGGMTREDEV